MEPNPNSISAEAVMEHYAQELAAMTRRAIIAETALAQFIARQEKTEEGEAS